MEFVLTCFPFVTALFPCALAYFWKHRNGLPWLLLSALSTYPLIVLNVRRVAESIGGNPMGGTKAALVVIASVATAIAVSILVALIPKNRTPQPNRIQLKKKPVLITTGILVVSLISLILIHRAKSIALHHDIQLAIQDPQQAAMKAVSEGNSYLLREAVNYWSFDDPAGALEWLESNGSHKKTEELKFSVFHTWILNEPNVALPRVESFLNNVSDQAPYFRPLAISYIEVRSKSDPDGARDWALENNISNAVNK